MSEQICSVCTAPLGKRNVSGMCRVCIIKKNRYIFKKRFILTPDIELMLRRAYTASSNAELFANLKEFRRRTGWTNGITTHYAGNLGIQKGRPRRWSKDELQFLEDNAGSMTSKAMAVKLGRSHAAVCNQLFTQGRLGRVSEGYSIPDIVVVLGVASTTVTGWMRKGMLSKSDDSGRVSEIQLGRFIRRHPEQYDLRRVDQAWFKGIVFPKAAMAELGGS